jgi:hypothetical protein
MSAVQADSGQLDIIERKQSTSDSSSVLGNKANGDEAENGAPQEGVEGIKGHSWTSYERLRPFILVSLALLILGWWISSIVLPATRHRWFVFRTPNLPSRLPSQSHSRVICCLLQDRTDVLGLVLYSVSYKNILTTAWTAVGLLRFPGYILISSG